MLEPKMWAKFSEEKQLPSWNSLKNVNFLDFSQNIEIKSFNLSILFGGGTVPDIGIGEPVSESSCVALL